MGETRIIVKLKRLDGLIRRQATGTPCELAEKFNISRSSVYRLIKILKKNGAPVAYCKHRESFYYKEIGHFVISFKRN